MKAKLVKIDYQFFLYDNDDNLIATTENTPYKRLSMKNCQAIERGYDLDELISAELEKLPYTKHLDDGQYNDGKLAGFEFGAYWGFQKALELMSDKKFSEEDLISMIEKSRETGLTAEYLILTKQQTEWNVEIITESIPADRAPNGWDIFPKLDADECLILKLKSE